MADGKLQIKMGFIEFLGEGETSWLSEQLDKILDRVDELSIMSRDTVEDKQAATTQQVNNQADAQTQSSIPLAQLFKEKNFGDNQVARFLATAIWLSMRGNKTPTTFDVTKALRDNHQPRLTNAADCLAKNVAKGFCEKQGKSFFVTPTGFESLKSLNA